MATADNNVPYDNKDSIAASAAGHFVEFIAIIEDFPLNFLQIAAIDYYYYYYLKDFLSQAAMTTETVDTFGKDEGEVACITCKD